MRMRFAHHVPAPARGDLHGYGESFAPQCRPAVTAASYEAAIVCTNAPSHHLDRLVARPRDARARAARPLSTPAARPADPADAAGAADASDPAHAGRHRDAA